MSYVATLIQGVAELASTVANIAAQHGEDAARIALSEALSSLRAKREQLDAIEDAEDARLAGLR